MIEQTEILLVDDNIFNLVTLQAILDMQFKKSSVTCSNGKEAVALFTRSFEGLERNPIRLIFMDCNMPVMDGFQATKAIREVEREHSVPDSEKCKIIALTAYDTENFKQKSFASGMNDFITKPVSKD